MVILWPRHAGGIASATQHGNCSNSRSCASGCCLERTLESCKAMRHTVDMYVYSMCLQDHSNREFRIKEVKTQKKCSGGGAHGGCIQDSENFEIKSAHGICGGPLLGPAFVFFFFRFFTSSFDVRAVDRSEVCPLSPRPVPRAPHSLSHNLRRHRSPTRRVWFQAGVLRHSAGYCFYDSGNFGKCQNP